MIAWLMLGVSMASLMLLVTLPKPNVLVSASLETESVDIRVLNADEMTLRFPKAILDDGAPVCRENLVVRVEPGGKLAFSRPEGEPLHIATEGMTQWSSGDGTSGSSADGVYIEVTPEADCATDRPSFRLPAVGELSVGMIASGSSSGDDFLPITGGELTVYGRAVDPPFATRFAFGFLPLEPEKLYVASSFPVPAGSQVEGGDARFWGFISVDLEARSGLHLEASTNARELSLFAPAPKISGAVSSTRATALEADRISMTLGAQLAGDPNLHLIFWAIAGLFAGVGFAVNLLKFFKEKESGTGAVPHAPAPSPVTAEATGLEPAAADSLRTSPVGAAKREPQPKAQDPC